jgi:VanZ family protein
MTKYCFYATITYLIFVVYGSLVPLDYHQIPWQEAQDKFKNIQYLDLGIESRADWIANILLYIPLAFLWSMLLRGIQNPFLRIAGTALILLSCLLLAVAVEFCQLFFPPRTVSINDLIAESMGTVLGVLIASIWGKYFAKLFNNVSLGGLLSIKALITLYLLGYMVLSFFPFDFVTSFAEFEAKLESGNDHIFLSLDACQNEPLRCLVKFCVEILVLLPAGGLLYLLPHIAYKLASAILIGFFLGCFTELVQLFLFSGTAQGLSVLTRILGMVLGVVIAKWLSKQKIAHWQQWLRPFVLIAALPYLAVIFIINGGLQGSWLDIASASTKLAETRFIPFYYFYFTTETIALVSLISNIGTYIPVGIAYWLWNCAKSPAKTVSWILIGASAAGLAFFVETQKLFLTEKHADPTDILIAFYAAAGSYVLINKTIYWLRLEKDTHSN